MCMNTNIHTNIHTFKHTYKHTWDGRQTAPRRQRAVRTAGGEGLGGVFPGMPLEERGREGRAWQQGGAQEGAQARDTCSQACQACDAAGAWHCFMPVLYAVSFRMEG